MAAPDIHPSIADLQAFVLGTLADGSLAAVETHMADCPACQERAAGVSGDTLVELLRRVHVHTTRHPETISETAHAETPSPVAADARVDTLTHIAADSHNDASSATIDAMRQELLQHERYRIVRLLGEGGMGSVYEAEHRVMQRAVALKVINSAFTSRPATVERFRREVRAAARLSHPNIVTTYDAEDAGSTLFLVMEYVEGVTLARLVKERGPLPIAEACDYVRQAAFGLQHAHERGMVHRDVKPDNLIRTPAGQVKVLDFGLAALRGESGGELTEENAVMGTPDYMAPEQAEDARSADIRADAYSLGCTLFYLLTGKVPYPAATAMLKILAHREQPLPSIRQARPEVPPELARIVARLLAKKPAERYQTPAEVAAALAPFADAQSQTARRGSKRGWLVAAAALFLGLFLTAGVVVYRIQTDRGELVITTESDDVEVVVKQGGKLVEIMDAKTKKKITLRSGVYDLELKDGKGLKLDLTKAMLTRGDTVLAKVERLPLPVANAKRPTDDQQPIAKKPAGPQPLEVAQRFPWPGRSDAKTCFSDDSRLCAAWTRDAMRVFDTQTGRLVQEFVGMPPWTITVGFLPDGKQLVSTHNDGMVRRWDVAKGKMLSQFDTKTGWPQVQGFSPAGDALCIWGAPVQVWDLKEGKKRFQVDPLRPQGSIAASAPVSPDGKRLLTVDFRGAEVDLRVFEVATGKQLLVKPTNLSADIQGWSADGKHIYLFAGDGQQTVIARLDADTGAVISKVPLAPRPGPAQGRKFSRDTRYFAVQYPPVNLVHLYDTHTGQLVLTANGPNPEYSLSFAPNGKYVACGGENEVTLYHLPAPAEIKQLPEKAVEVLRKRWDGHVNSSVDLSPDGQLLAAGYWGVTRVWDVSTGKPIREHPGWIGRFTPDGKRIVIADKCLHVYDAENGKLIRQCTPAFTRGFWDVQVLSDGKRAITASADRVWDLETGKMLHSWPLDEKTPPPAMDADPTYSIACRGPRKLDSVADGMVLAFDRASGKEVARMSAGNFQPKNLSISRDGRFAAACAANQESDVVVWRLPEPAGKAKP
jgi:WD40 repeat protein